MARRGSTNTVGCPNVVLNGLSVAIASSAVLLSTFRTSALRSTDVAFPIRILFDLWLIDLDMGDARPLTHLAADFNIHDFDISRDGREVVLERVQEQSDVVLLSVR